MIEIDLKKCRYEFLIVLLSCRKSLSTQNKAEILKELALRNRSDDTPVKLPH